MTRAASAPLLLLALAGPALAQPVYPAAPTTAALQNANRTAAADGRIVSVRPGAVALAGTVFSDPATVWTFGPGVDITGAAIDAVVDASALRQAGLGYARLLAGSSTHVMALQGRADALSPQPGTESAGLVVSLLNQRPSDYAARQLHDVVGIEVQNHIQPGTAHARSWGHSAVVGHREPGTPGYVVGAEMTVQNSSGTDAGEEGSTTAQQAFHAVAAGTNAVTAAMVLHAPEAARFKDGIVVGQNTLSPGGHALSVRRDGGTSAADDLGWMDANGAIGVRQLGIGTPAGPAARKFLLFRSVKAADGEMELTIDGQPASAANTIPIRPNSAAVFRTVRYLVRNPATGRVEHLSAQEVLVARAAAPASLSISPPNPAFTSLGAIGGPPSGLGLHVRPDTTNGRVAFLLGTGSPTPVTASAEIELIETP